MNLSENFAEKFTNYCINPGPALSQYEAEAVVHDLRQQAAYAPKIVGEITGLQEAAMQAAQIPVVVLNRAKWAKACAYFINTMIKNAANPNIAKLAPLGNLIIAPALGFIATKVLGQFDPYGKNLLQSKSANNSDLQKTDPAAAEIVGMPDAKLMLIAPNLAEFRQENNLDQRDLALWVCVHEFTHALQYIHASWLGDYLLTKMNTVFNTESSETEPAIAEIQNVMSILEGHAQYVMNSVPLRIMPSRNAIMQALAKKREKSSWREEKIVALFGLDQKVAQYSRGEDFVKFAVEQGGMKAFNRIWECPENFPNDSEFANPQQWLARLGIEAA